MESSDIFAWVVFFVVFWLGITIYGKLKKRRMIKDIVTTTVNSAKNQKNYVDPHIKKLRRYMAETVPVLLDDYHVFVPSFYSRYAARCLKDGRTTNITKDDLVDGISFNEALWTLSHCELLASARYHAIDIIENAPKVEVKFIDFEVWRPNPDCPRVPQNKVYDIDEDIPIFPCADCKEEKICIFNYKNVF